MTTLLDLQTNVANDLTRADLTTQIASAVSDAIKDNETARFWFNVTRSLTFSTVPTQSTYTAADLAQIPDIIRIDHLYLLQTPNSVYELDWAEPDEFEWLISGTTGPGKPSVFTYVDSTILLWPIPTQVWTLRPHMHYRLAPLVNPTDSNGWTTYGERFIRAHAKLILYTNVLEDLEGAQRMQGEVQTYRDKLDYETSARTATGRVRSTNF